MHPPEEPGKNSMHGTHSVMGHVSNYAQLHACRQEMVQAHTLKAGIRLQNEALLLSSSLFQARDAIALRERAPHVPCKKQCKQAQRVQLLPQHDASQAVFLQACKPGPGWV